MRLARTVLAALVAAAVAAGGGGGVEAAGAAGRLARALAPAEEAADGAAPSRVPPPNEDEEELAEQLAQAAPPAGQAPQQVLQAAGAGDKAAVQQVVRQAEQQQRADEQAAKAPPAQQRKAEEQAAREQAAKDEAEDKKVNLPDDLEAFLRPSYEQAVGAALEVAVPGGLSPVDAAKYRIAALRRRLKAVSDRRAALVRRRGQAARAADEAFVRMENAGDDLHRAYVKHEEAARGEDLDHVKGDPETLREVVTAADKVLAAQESHFNLADDWSTSLPLGYDQELALDNTRLRLQRAIASLETQLASSISASVARAAEKSGVGSVE